MAYSTKKIDIIHNTNGITFYKLLFEGKCLFDEFVEKINLVDIDKKHFISLVAWLENYSPTLFMPSTKIEHIHQVGRSDVFEFKKDNLRVYAILQNPNVFVILGGYKTEQKNDIKHIKSLLKQVPQQLTINTITND